MQLRSNPAIQPKTYGGTGRAVSKSKSKLTTGSQWFAGGLYVCVEVSIPQPWLQVHYCHNALSDVLVPHAVAKADVYINHAHPGVANR